jgi:hypothetical protein
MNIHHQGLFQGKKGQKTAREDIPTWKNVLRGKKTFH